MSQAPRNQLNTLMKIQNLSVTFQESKRPAVDDITLHLKKGRIHALVGESGSGKSLTALSIVRLTPATARLSGRILYKGDNLITCPEKRLRGIRSQKVGVVFQEPLTSLNPLHTIGKQIREAITLHKAIGTAAANRSVLGLLEKVRLPNPKRIFDAYPHQLSGGQRQRVMIAMALANDPELLIADEPTTALDVTIQKEILDLLIQLQHQHQMAILLISHDLNLVRRVADDVSVMSNGEIIESGPKASVFNVPRHPYTKKLLASEPKGAPEPVLLPDSCLLSVRDLSVRLPLHKSLFKKRQFANIISNVSFSLAEGETLGIVGESGSGKSTIANALLRLINSTGEVRYQWNRLDKLSDKAFGKYRKSLQVVFQDPFNSLSPRLTVEKIVKEGLEIHRKELTDDEMTLLVCDTLRSVGLDPEIRHRYPHEFSGGQRQRIAIARVLVLRPKILILDEPSSALDRTVQIQILELLKNIQQTYGISYLFISHDMSVIRAMSHKIMVIKDGQVVELGDSQALMNQPKAPYTQKLLSASFV